MVGSSVVIGQILSPRMGPKSSLKNSGPLVIEAAPDVSVPEVASTTDSVTVASGPLAAGTLPLERLNTAIASTTTITPNPVAIAIQGRRVDRVAPVGRKTVLPLSCTAVTAPPPIAVSKSARKSAAVA